MALETQEMEAVTEITFKNMAEIRVQAQVYAGRTLVSSSVADPGESLVLAADPARNDIYLKNSATGRELGRLLNSETKSVTLSLHNGRYLIS